MPTRISTAQVYSNAQAQIAGAKDRENTTAEKAGTMKEIVRPSQNPGGYLKAANLKDDVGFKQSIAKNASLAMHTLNVTENMLTALQEHTQRAHEIAVGSAGTESNNAAAQKHLLAEAKSIFTNVIQLLNTKYANRTLLSGLKGQDLAFDKEGNYLGDSKPFEIEIDRDLRIQLNLPGDLVAFGAGKEGGVNWLQAFRRLRSGMESGDIEEIRSTLEDFSKANDHLSSMRTELAGRMTQIEGTLRAHEISIIESKDAIAKVEEADAVKVFSELARDQAVLGAAMATTQKLLANYPAEILFK